MRAEHENIGARIAGNSSDDIRHRRAGRVGVARKRLLQRDPISKLAKLRRHAIAHDVVSRRTDRMRRSIAENRTEDGDRARRRKAIRRSMGRERRGAATLNDYRRENRSQDQKYDRCGAIR